jgi:hypothetical protein
VFKLFKDFNVTSPWRDVETAAPEIRKPINIRRTMLSRPITLQRDDILDVRITHEELDGQGNACRRIEQCPQFEIDRDFTVDSVTRFEVIDEFGVDVGIGFVLGQTKR